MTDMSAVNDTAYESINVELHVVSRPMINKAARAGGCGATAILHGPILSDAETIDLIAAIDGSVAHDINQWMRGRV